MRLDMSPAARIGHACAIASREMTAQEWHDALPAAATAALRDLNYRRMGAELPPMRSLWRSTADGGRNEGASAMLNQRTAPIVAALALAGSGPSRPRSPRRRTSAPAT